MLPRLLPILLCLLVLAPAAPAAAASGFVGVNFDGEAVKAPDIGRELRRAARAGAGSVRIAMYWPELQPHGSWADIPARERRHFHSVRGVPTDFRATDRVVRIAARVRLDLTPVVMSTAPWAAENPFVAFSPPADPAEFGRFARTLAERYGRGGRFWRRHRRLPRRPIRTWQIWNEPAGIDGFGSASWAWQSSRDPLTGYRAMLRSARAGLRAADPRAQVMLSGFFGKSWVALEEAYKAGYRGLFDSVGIHPYTREPEGALEIVRLARDVMSRYGDARKPIAVTEVSWTSSAGRVSPVLPFSTDEAGQAQRLARMYRLLRRAAPSLRISRVYWYTWLTQDVSTQSTFDYAGLLTRRGGRVVPKPAFRAFRRVARRLDGRAR